VTIIIPVRTWSEANCRPHWAAKAKRVKSQRQTAAIHLQAAGVKAFANEWRRSFPLVVTLTRLASRQLDDDNLRGALKAVRDEVARQLNVDDGEALVRWEYGQKKAKRGVYAVWVDIRSEGDDA